MKIGPATAVVISSPAILKKLIDQRSNIYSARPPSYVSHELITKGDHLLIMTNNEKWKLFRKLVHQTFNQSRCEKEHITLQDAEAVQMLKDFCDEPENLMSHPKRFSNSIIMSLLYGIRSPRSTTPHFVQLYSMMEEWSEVMETGATPPVDIIPALKWVPEGLLGNWITRSRNVGKAMDNLYGSLVRHVQRRRAKVGSRDSFLDSILDQPKLVQDLTPNQINFLCGVVLEGGSDTSASIILAFIHAMIKFPQVQEKAQQEIDAVVGDTRSPVWSDYSKLPYTAMVIKETMRWRPVTPLAFPHCSSKDDTIDGMKIPKGSTVLLNVWGLHHDPVRHPNPDIFDPERYAGRTLPASEYINSSDPEQRDHWAYGSGRRICPGIHLAERNLFLAISKLLWAFHIAPKETARGRPIQVDVNARSGYSEGFLHCPKPFQAEFRIRGEGKREVIKREYERAEKDVFAKYEDIDAEEGKDKIEV